MLARLLAALALVLPPAALIPPTTAAAATVRRLELPDLVRLADLIVLATVQATEPTRRGKRIVTRATLLPETTLKGTPPDPLVVEVPGGVIGGIGQKVPGAARFDVGEQVIVFLEASAPDAPLAVVGMAQGKLRVVPGLDGARLAATSTTSASSTSPPTAPSPATAPPPRGAADPPRRRDQRACKPAPEAPADPDALDPRPDAPTVRPDRR
ncbi:MAG: hypothetical protein R3F65_14550 [bacterium]